MVAMTKQRPLPDLSKLSVAEKDRLIVRLHARVRAEEAKLDIAESARWRVERPRFLAGEANNGNRIVPAVDGQQPWLAVQFESALSRCGQVALAWLTSLLPAAAA